MCIIQRSALEPNKVGYWLLPSHDALLPPKLPLAKDVLVVVIIPLTVAAPLTCNLAPLSVMVPSNKLPDEFKVIGLPQVNAAPAPLELVVAV